MEGHSIHSEQIMHANIMQYGGIVFWREYAKFQEQACGLYGGDYFPKRDDLSNEIRRLCTDEEFKSIYNQVNRLSPQIYAFHGSPHANRVLAMTISLKQAEAATMNHKLATILEKDAYKHDLMLENVGYQGHEDPFGQFSMIRATKIMPEFSEVDGEKKLTGLHQIVDEPGVFEEGGKLYSVVESYVSQGYERDEVIKAMDIIADVDLLGLGNSKGMVALLLEEFMVHNRVDHEMGELIYKHDRRDPAKAKESIKASMRGSIMIYESKIRNGFRTELANRMLPKGILEERKLYVENMLAGIDDCFDTFWGKSEEYRNGKSEIKTYAETFKLVSEIKDAIDHVNYIPVDLSMVPTSVIEVLFESFVIPDSGDRREELENARTSVMYELLLRQRNELSYPEVDSIKRALQLDYNQLLRIIENIDSIELETYKCHQIQKERIGDTDEFRMNVYERFVQDRMHCLNITDGLLRITGCCATCYYGLRNRASILQANEVHPSFQTDSTAGCAYGMEAIKDEMIEFQQYIEDLLKQKHVNKPKMIVS
jgi:hypothetical protein